MITLPLWLFVVIVLLAAWAALDRLMVPSVRWIVRQRTNRVIEEINTRLPIEIPQFNLTRRQVLIDRLMYDPRVVQAADAFAREHGMPREVAMERVERYAREIVPAFNAYLYFRIGYWAARRFARLLYRVRLGYSDEAGLAGIAKGSTVVFVMNHRSNMDYVLVGYLASKRAALSYAVGEWARVWPLQALIRSMGAYFVRRNSGDELYRRVLERYVGMATAAGVTQAVYPEGGLTRDGRLRRPKLGLLDYILRAFDPAGERDLVFIPVGINYDRTLEDRTLLLDLQPERAKPRPMAAAANALRFAGRNVMLMARSRWHRFGYACANFGTPVSMRAYCAGHGIDFRAMGKDERHAAVEALGADLMRAVGDVVPVVPVSLVATVFVRDPARPLSELELKARVGDLIDELEAAGGRVYIPRKDMDYAVTVGLRMLTLRHLVREEDGLFCAAPSELAVLAYYANSIAHLLPLRPVSVAMPVGIAEPVAAPA
ncbi:1-acyl-sn-glycerol-3-phosphate acyltransferase [Longimicrobium sp.]|uniref:1-acyl-sn-glycerol-3-phosphate acyltransferase n=1 Tax=Longimicrobium sp. TaxID=2029185 RepID=UPI002B9CF0C4|nr:1-acyl-sn-glycerol-3-phosphate acyltransferase [Longimicrobium sp.]HSU16201.1 1-acyl-sn-glycerol-3-phosphate acyltransferase [Longimicrobium sp.]